MKKLLSVEFAKDEDEGDFNIKSCRKWLQEHDLLHKIVSKDLRGSYYCYNFVNDYELISRGSDDIREYPAYGIIVTYRKDKHERWFEYVCVIEEKEDLDDFYNAIEID